MSALPDAVRRVSLPRWLPALLLPLLALPALWPLWRIGLPGTADGTLHLLRVALLDYHVSQGMLFPRWMPELVLGYGYPLLNFYGPTTYYLAEALHLLGLGHSTALMAAFGVLILAAGYGALLLASDIFSDHITESLTSENGRTVSNVASWAALTAAVAYLYTPYLLTNVYMRGALAEVGAQALLPWIFWSFRRLLRDPQPGFYVLPAALSLGGLAATHNITLLWIPLTLLAYIAVLWWDTRSWQALRWPIVGGLAALGVSAFFWAPLILERDNLSGVAFDIAATYMAENVWTLSNFLDWHLPFHYTLSIPFQLGALQLGLALLGFVLLRPKNAEWWYWLVLALVGMLGISSMALPLWMNNELLLIAQFPWRLLSIVSVPLALFTGALVLRLRSAWALVGGVVVLLTVIILTQRPQSAAMETLIRADRDLTPAEVAQFELDTNAFGTSSSSEFLPRWAGNALFAPLPSTGSAPIAPAISLQATSPFRMHMDVDAPVAGPLHFATFYFPGWQATLDGTPVAVYPETRRGLLTVDMPAGPSQLEIAWTGTHVQRIGNWISLLTLAGLLGLVLWLTRRRPARSALLALTPMLLLLWGLLATRPAPPAVTVQSPSASLSDHGLSLLGTRAEIQEEGFVMVYPTWLVEATPDDLRVTWTLRDAAGATYQLASSRPFFNTLETATWLPLTIVDDAYRLALPPDLSAGAYELEVSLAGPDAATTPVTAASIVLEEATSPALAPPLTLGWRYGKQAQLAGASLRHNDRLVPLDGGQPPAVQPGDRLIYELHWLGDGAIEENYHAFLHLLDHTETPLLQGDQLPGPVFSPPRLWNAYRAAPDVYRFTVPEDAPSGLYRGAVGLYRFPDGERLPVTDESGEPLGDRGLLPPVKIVNPSDQRPETRMDAKFAGVGTLTGYTIKPEGVMRPGDEVLLTLFYRADGPATTDYTQFVHVYNPTLGMAAQRDGQPGAGGNPTSVWTAGEFIVEEIVLAVAPDAQPGTYDVLVGLYDAGAGATRVPVTDRNGELYVDDQIPLMEIEIVD